MTRVAYELAQFVNDLRTITAEMHDLRASLVRVPLALRAHGPFRPTRSKASSTSQRHVAVSRLHVALAVRSRAGRPYQEVSIMMRLTKTSLALVLMAAITASAIGVLAVSAQEKKEVYVPTADLKTLVDNKPLHGVDGKHVTILHGAFPAGWLGGRHYHTGPVYVYVLEGSFTIDEQGKSRQTFTVGQLYEEPIGTPMQARNISTSEQLKVLLFQVHGQGEPLAYKVE
jgi:quercetin dioxygenase-like cupin family protein